MLRKNTLTLVVVFAVLLTALLLIQRNNELNPTIPESDAPTVPPPVYLFEFSSESVVDVLIEGDGQVIEMQKGADGVWLLLEPPTLPDGTDQTPITSMLSQLGTVRILSELTSSPGLDVIGLDQPGTIITFTLDSGETVVLQVGDGSPTGNGYYVRVNGGSPKLVDRFVIDRLTGFLTTPPLMPTPVLSTTLGITPTLDITTPIP